MLHQAGGDYAVDALDDLVDVAIEVTAHVQDVGPVNDHATVPQYPVLIVLEGHDPRCVEANDAHDVHHPFGAADPQMDRRETAAMNRSRPEYARTLAGVRRPPRGLPSPIQLPLAIDGRSKSALNLAGNPRREIVVG